MSKHNGDKKVVEISKSLIEDSNDRDNVSSNLQSQIKSSFECILNMFYLSYFQPEWCILGTV